MAGGPSAPYSEAYGSRSATGIAKETSFGQVVAATNFFPMTGNTLEEAPGLFYPQVMQGQRDMNIYPVYGEYAVSGTIDGPLFPSMGIPMLAYAIGTDTVTGTTAPYTHTFAQAVDLASMTIEKNVGDKESQQFFGCRVNKYTLTGQATNTEADISVDVIGQGYQTLTAPTAITTVNESPFIFAEAALSFLGQSVGTVVSFEVDIQNGLQATYTMNGTHYLEYLTPVTLMVNGTLEVVFDSFDDPTYGYYSKMINATSGALTITLTHPASGGSVEINLPEVRLATIAIAPSLTSVVLETLSWTAEYSQTSGFTVGATVTNSVSTAY